MREYIKQIVIHKEELLFDIENITHKIGNSRMNLDNKEQRAVYNLQADDGEQDRSIVFRSISKHISRAKNRMNVYLITKSPEVECNHLVTDENEKDYVIVLRFPWNWCDDYFTQLSDAIHDYVVNACIFDFLLISAPSEAKIYKDLSDIAYDNIKTCISARLAGTTRRPLQPFREK